MRPAPGRHSRFFVDAPDYFLSYPRLGELLAAAGGHHRARPGASWSAPVFGVVLADLSLERVGDLVMTAAGPEFREAP